MRVVVGPVQIGQVYILREEVVDMEHQVKMVLGEERAAHHMAIPTWNRSTLGRVAEDRIIITAT